MALASVPHPNLLGDRYSGGITLETHWQGPRNDKFEASVMCGTALRALVSV